MSPHVKHPEKLEQEIKDGWKQDKPHAPDNRENTPYQGEHMSNVFKKSTHDQRGTLTSAALQQHEEANKNQ
jgi:hypothetical protein